MYWKQVTVVGCNGCKGLTALIPPFQEPISLHPVAFGRRFPEAESFPHGNVLGVVLRSHSAFGGLPWPSYNPASPYSTMDLGFLGKAKPTLQGLGFLGLSKSKQEQSEGRALYHWNNGVLHP